VVQDASVSTDHSAFVENVWREHGTKLWRSVLEFSGDPDVASEAVSEAFAQALARDAAIQDAERWIWRASFLIARGILKDRGRAPVLRQVSPVEPPEPITDLVQALRRLSPNQRAAAVLHYYADLPTAEVARILGCSQTTVRVHLMQARRRLRTLLGADNDD
jgi:RNA polymerase sigma factor (sigma-70 family)